MRRSKLGGIGHAVAGGLLAGLLAAAPAGAERTASHVVKACGLTGAPTSVVVDVYDDAAPGAVLATIQNAEVQRIGSLDCYQTDLAATTAAISYPGPDDPTERSYTVVFRDDAGNQVPLTEVVAGVVGPHSVLGRCERPVPVYATTPIPSRGITQAVILDGKPSYIKYEIDCTLQFTSPVVTWYEVYYYDGSGRVLERRPSLTPPNP